MFQGRARAVWHHGRSVLVRGNLCGPDGLLSLVYCLWHQAIRSSQVPLSLFSCCSHVPPLCMAEAVQHYWVGGRLRRSSVQDRTGRVVYDLKRGKYTTVNGAVGLHPMLCRLIPVRVTLCPSHPPHRRKSDAGLHESNPVSAGGVSPNLVAGSRRGAEGALVLGQVRVGQRGT